MGTQKVIQPDQVYLGGNFYKIEGKINRKLLSRFPQKTNIGDYSYGNEMFRSNWVTNDQRGGIGVEDFDISKPEHLRRCWWSTLDLDWAGHLLLPPLATSIPTPNAATPTGNTEGSGWSNGAQAYDDNLTNYASGACTAGWSGYLELAFTSATMIGVWFKSGRADAVVDDMEIDYYDGSWHTIGDVTAYIVSTTTIAITATGVTALRVRYQSSGAATVGYLYEIRLITTTTPTIATCRWCNFNSNLYLGVNRVLCKLNSTTGAAFVPVGYFPANITDLVSTVGSQMTILLGDSNAFWYMSTAEALTQTDETGAYWGVHWDNKFCWINSTGSQFSYAATLAATIVETDNGVIPGGVTVNALKVYMDTTGADIVYACTKDQLWAHDFANATFVATNMSFATHPNAGKGMMVWGGSLYVPMGVHIKKYTVGNGVAYVDSVGLDKDDGLPAEYNGEIVSLIEDSEHYYALVDASQVGTTGQSWVAKWNGYGWTCHNLDTTAANHAMNSGVVSSVYTRRIYWNSGNVIYSTALPRTKLNPKKNTNYVYAATGFHITPWFDGGSKIFSKLALAFKTFAKSITTTETIVVKYRTNKTNTDISTGWTTLVTLDTTGENNAVSTDLETTGSTGDGLSNNTIQFYFYLARDSSTTSPDLQGVSLGYFVDSEMLNAWTFEIITPDATQKTARQLEEALHTLAATLPLSEFIYRDDSGATNRYYVKIVGLEETTPTGNDYKAKFKLTVVQL